MNLGWRAFFFAPTGKHLVETGRVFQTSEKLYHIEGVALQGGTTSTSGDDWYKPLHDHYSSKWGANRLQARSLVLDFISKSEGVSVKLDWALIVRALDTIHKTGAKDTAGVSVLIIRAFVFGCPDAATGVFSRLLTSRSFMESFYVHGKLYGKESKFPSPAKTRAILPLPALLIVVDAIVALQMGELIDTCCRPPLGVMFGARKGTQVLDVAHAAQLHLQKGGDNFGVAGLAQGDIATYYDSLSCLRIAQWLVHHGLPYVWASAFLRVQLLPTVRLSAGHSCVFDILCRSFGTLTGSRTANAAGRIPVESAACKLASSWEVDGVKTTCCSVVFASWVDNYYTFGRSLHSALRIAESFEEALSRDWGLHIKASSRSVMSPTEPEDDWDDVKWPRCAEADILGHLVSADCSPWPCWRRTQRSMWASFWKNCVGPAARGLSLNERCKMLNRCVRPVLFFRNTRWPFTTALADEQNRTQRQMLSHFLHLERFPFEDDRAFHRRRMRLIAGVARQHGVWGEDHARRIVDWSEHLSRARNNTSISSLLYMWHNADWLQQRRRDPLIGQSQRPGTRHCSGPVYRRWDESLMLAKQHCRS